MLSSVKELLAAALYSTNRQGGIDLHIYLSASKQISAFPEMPNDASNVKSRSYTPL